MGHVKSGTEAYPGWVPGPNPFGNQRASDCETWYRPYRSRQLEIRRNFMTDLWQINEASVVTTTVNGVFGGKRYGAFRPLTYQEFSDPVGAMLWFELNKADL